VNWIILTGIGIAAISLIVFLFRKNQQDRKKFEKFLNSNYQKPIKHPDESESEINPE